MTSAALRCRFTLVKFRHGSLALLLLFGGALHAQSGQGPLQDEGARAEEAALEKAADTIFAEAGYVWEVSEDGMSVQFGVPQTDDLAFRVDCEDGNLIIIAPANTDAPEGTPTTALFQNGERRAGTISYLGEDPGFAVSVAATDPIVGALLTSDRIHIDTAEAAVSVSGAKGSVPLRSLVKRCRNRKP